MKRIMGKVCYQCIHFNILIYIENKFASNLSNNIFSTFFIFYFLYFNNLKLYILKLTDYIHEI